MYKLLAFAAALAACLALCQAAHLQAVATLADGKGYCFVSGNNNTKTVEFAVRCAAGCHRMAVPFRPTGTSVGQMRASSHLPPAASPASPTSR